MNAPLLIAAALALAGAAVHGIVGDGLVRKLDRASLPRSPIGGPDSTFTLIRVSWHLVTLTFFVSAIALAWVSVCSDAALVRGVGLVMAALYASFAALTVPVALMRSRSGLLRHPAPIGFCVTAALIWWGL